MNDIFFATASRTRLVIYCLGFSFAILFGIYNLLKGYNLSIIFGLHYAPPQPPPPWAFHAKRDALNYGLTMNQCDAAFPGLFREIDSAVARRRGNPVSKAELETAARLDRTVRIRVWDEQIYVVSAVLSDIQRSRVYSTLRNLNLALAYSRDHAKLPNIEAVISMDDYHVNNNASVWSYSRTCREQNTWLLPDLGFSEPSGQSVETYAEARRRIANVEKRFPSLRNKIQKLVLRGAIARLFSQPLRQKFVDVVANKSWADMDSLGATEPDNQKRHPTPIEDQCKYAFIANTEGLASLKYVQNCESVIVAHEQRHLQHHHHLMKDEGPQQNYVKIRRDFADLSEKMESLVVNPDLAKRIAENNVETFRDRYLTPAAEACYWRRLIRGWAAVSFRPEFHMRGRHEHKWRE